MAVEDYLSKYEGKSYEDIAKLFAELKKEKERQKKAMSALTDEWDALTIHIIPEMLAEDGMASVNLDSGYRIQTSPQAYCSTVAGMSAEVRAWMIDNGHEEMISETINPQTLKAFIKESIDNGDEIPSDDIVNYQPYIRASVVKR